MQDLIIISFVLTPLMVLVLRNKMATIMTLLLLSGLACLKITFSWLGTSSVLMFFIGGTLAVYASEFFERRQNIKIAYGCLVVLLICCIVKYFDIPKIEELCLYISPLLMWKAFDLLNLHKAYWFEHQSFFIYSVHVIPVTVFGHLLNKISTNPIWAAVAYLIAIGVTLVMIYVMSKVLNIISPRFYNLICGGR